MDTSGSDRFLIDGFPRANDQAKTFEAQVQPRADKGRCSATTRSFLFGKP